MDSSAQSDTWMAAHLGDNAVKQLAALAQLQYEIHIVPVLECLPQRGDVGMVAHQFQHLDMARAGVGTESRTESRRVMRRALCHQPAGTGMHARKDSRVVE